MKITLKTVALYVMGLAVPTIISYYIGKLLVGKINLKCYQTSDIIAREGTSRVNEKLSLRISGVTYDGKDRDAVRVIKFLILNNDWQHLDAGAHFIFTHKGSTPIPFDAVLNVSIECLTPTEDRILTKTIEDRNSEPGFKIESDLPGHSTLEVTLALDISAFPEMTGDIIVKKSARKRERLHLITDPSSSMISVKVSHFVLWLACVAALYSTAWLLINIYTGNYSTGAQIVDLIFRLIFSRGIIPTNGPTLF